MNYYEVNAISNSGLSLINPEQGGSPKKYKKYIVDKDKPDDDTPTLKNGRLIHKYIEAPDEFIIDDGVRPSDMMCGWVDDVYSQHEAMLDVFTLRELALDLIGDRYKSTKDLDKLWDKFNNEGLDYFNFLKKANGRILMDKATKAILDGTITSMKENPTVNEFLFNKADEEIAHNELAIYWTNEFNQKCKSLLDRVIINPVTCEVKLIDVKTTSKPMSLFKESFEKYHYYRQLAFYKKALFHFLLEQYPETQISDWNIEAYIAVIETTGLYECKIVKIDDGYMEYGLVEVMMLLKLVFTHTQNNTWSNPNKIELMKPL